MFLVTCYGHQAKAYVSVLSSTGMHCLYCFYDEWMKAVKFYHRELEHLLLL